MLSKYKDHQHRQHMFWQPPAHKHKHARVSSKQFVIRLNKSFQELLVSLFTALSCAARVRARCQGILCHCHQPLPPADPLKGASSFRELVPRASSATKAECGDLKHHGCKCSMTFCAAIPTTDASRCGGGMAAAMRGKTGQTA